MKLATALTCLILCLFTASSSFAKGSVKSDTELIDEVVRAYEANWQTVTVRTYSGLVVDAQFIAGSGNTVKCSVDYGRIFCCEIRANGESFNYVRAE